MRRRRSSCRGAQLSIWHRVILPAWAQRSCGTLLRTRREPLPGASGATSMSLTVLSKVPHTLCYLRNHSSLVSINCARWLCSGHPLDQNLAAQAGLSAGSRLHLLSPCPEHNPPQRPHPNVKLGNVRTNFLNLEISGTVSVPMFILI